MKTTPFIKKLYPFALLAALALPAGNAWAQEETPETASPGGESPPPETMAEPMLQEGQDEEMAVELEEFVFVGSRRQDRSVADSPVPVDVIDGEDFATQGYTDMDSMLSTVIPSYNVNTQPISDAATFVRPANLRGLSPDSTLVLINGKRRHRASVITFLGGGVSDGSQAPDLASIPFIALERVEVLRDGASAQYGSDAVAGVLNFVLKDDAQGGRVETRWGQYYEGDGSTYTVAANAGMPLVWQGEKRGFANFSVEYTQADPTVRSVQRADAQTLIADGLPVREPYAQIWGSPEVDYDFKFFGNLGLKISDNAEVYLVPSFAKREVEGGFFFRTPSSGVLDVDIDGNGKLDDRFNARAAVFRGPVINGEPTIKVAALRGLNAGLPLPEGVLVADDGSLGIPIVDNVPDPNALKAVAENPNFFAFNEKFPGGFTPQFGGEVTDMAIAGGVKGDMESEWHYDFGASIGEHKTEFYMRNTINPQLIAHPDFIDNPAGIPTNLRPGNYTERDYTINLDVARPFSMGNVAAGLEYREEEFEVEAGDEYAWWADSREDGIAAQGFGVGSNGFPAFPPRIAGATDRGSYAAYLDVEVDVTEDWIAGAAVRYEDHEGFGDTLNGKLSSRWQMSDTVALRGSLSSGFRVPTLGQASIRNVTTAFSPNPATGLPELNDVATIPASEAASSFDGVSELEPETSINVSLGTVISVGDLDVTIDYYYIKMEDRIALTSFQPWPTLDLEGNEIPNPGNYTQARWFSNDFDTATQGVDIVATYPIIEHSVGATVLTFAGNINATEVRRHGAYVDADRVDELENALPKFRANLSAVHNIGNWNVLLPRLRYYSSFVEYTADATAWKVDASPRLLVDAEVEYNFNNGVSLALGAQNLFDTYPEKAVAGARAGVGTLYPESSPYGFNGGFYYLKAAYTF